MEIKRPRPRNLGGRDTRAAETSVGALRIRIGFWGPLHYNYDKEPPSKYW